MSQNKRTTAWLPAIVAFFLGGLGVWLWHRLTSPPTLPAVPTASPADYETWLDWLVSRRRTQLASPALPELPRYRTWLDIIFDHLPFHWIIAAIAIALCTFVYGLFLAAIFGFVPLFLRTPAIYLAVVGTGLGLAALRWVSQAFPPAFAALGPYFGIPAETYADFLNRRLRKMYNNKATLTISGIIILASFGAMVGVFLFPHLTVGPLQAIAPSLVTLEAEWYFGSAPAAKMAIIDLYFLINFAAVVTGAWLCIYALCVLYDLASLAILPIPSVMALKLREVTNIFLVVCLIWLVAVADFVLLFRNAFDVLSIAWIGSQAVLTLATFLLPQYLSYRIILNLRQELITATRLAFDEYFQSFEARRLDPQKRLKLLDQLAHEADSIKAWPAEPFDWLLMLAGEALPPVTALVRNWISNLIKLS